MADHLPDGYELALCTALTQPVLVAGVPRTYAILVGTVTAAFTLALHFWLFGSAVGITTYAIGRYITARDPQGFRCWAKHLQQPDIYEA